MEIVNQIGHIQYWGISPAINFLKQSEPQQRTLRVLMTGCSDIRHILKTLTEIQKLNHVPNLEVYFHETQKELIARSLLLLHILHQQNMNEDERVELFLDLYGNALIKEKTAKYLDQMTFDLLDFIHEEPKTLTNLKKYVDLKHMKFEERDELSEIVQSWKIKVPFDIETLRDKRLRFHYKDRYDFRSNLIDWDYNMMLRDYAPIIHYAHYKEWRQTGLAFENRFSTYIQPNRTLSSYVTGKKNTTKQSCLVRGYWGDIVCSPYIAFGVECDYPQSKKLFQKANQKYIGHAVEISEYNLHYYLHRLETLQEYKKIFEDYYRSEERDKEREEEKKKEQQEEEKKKKQEKAEANKFKKKKKDEQKEEEAEEEKPPQQSKPARMTQEEYDQKLKIQRLEKDKKDFEYLRQEQPVLKGMQACGFKMYPMCMDLESLKKKKYQDFFDVGVIGFSHSAYLTKDIKCVFKTGAKIFCQGTRFLVSHRKQERQELDKKLEALIKDNGFLVLDKKLQHHFQCAKP